MPREQRKNCKYTVETKMQTVQAYKRGEGSLWNTCHAYGIKDEKSLQEWIMWYNDHKGFKEPSMAKGEIYLTKGRKTTQEE